MTAASLQAVLITQRELVNYAGSEIITLELAEHFSRMGSVVHVLTHTYGAPIEKEFKALKNVFVHTDEEAIDFAALSLVWIHHQLIPEKLVRLAEVGSLQARVVFHHMSGYHPLEFPFFARIEAALADMVLYNSPETKKEILSRLDGEHLDGAVFGNPAPDSFGAVAAGRKYNDRLGKLLVVSNHPPAELTLAMEDLALQHHVEVRHFGATSGQAYKRIQPEDLAWADVVVSIGKTVQYAMAAGVPVYCYDHFGGPGYLDKKNFDTAAQLNFSGRGFGKMTPEELASDILGRFGPAKTFARLAQRQHSPRYSLSGKLKEVFGAIDWAAPKEPLKLEGMDKAAYFALHQHLGNLHRAYHDVQRGFNDATTRHTAQVASHENQIHMLTQEIERLNSILTEVYESKSWKLTEPLRKANKTLRGEDG